MRIKGLVRYSQGISVFISPPPPPPPTLHPPYIISTTVSPGLAGDEGDTLNLAWALGGGTPTNQTVNFGDGSAPYTVTVGTLNQSHTYDNAGNYTITLSVSNLDGSASANIAGIDISGDVTPVIPPTITGFDTDSITYNEGDIATAIWAISGDPVTLQLVNFGDGSATYTVAPGTTTLMHPYEDAGSYTPTLYVENSADSDTANAPEVTVDVVPTSDTWPAADNAEIYFSRPYQDFTFTQRNFSGSSKTYAPVKQRYHFDHGNFHPATEELYAELGGVEVPLQVSERTFYPDGYLQNCTLHVVHVASWANNTDKTWTIKKRAGALHAETDSRATSLITGSYDAKLRFTDVKRIVNLTTWGSGTFESTLNDALGRTGILIKTAGGPIYSEWWCWDYVKDTTGGASDTFWYVIHTIGVYCDSGTNTIRAVVWEPVVGHGYPRAVGPNLIYKCEAYDGASLIRDFTGTFTRGSADIDATNNQLTRPISGAAIIPNGGAYISGDLPSGLSTGYYDLVQVGETGWDPSTSTLRGFAVGFRDRNSFNNLDIGANGGGSFTIETRIRGVQRNAWHATDDEGWSFFLTNSCRIAPNWSSAEKKHFFERGMIRSIPYDALQDGGMITGLKYYPMSLQIHRSLSEGPGGAAHIGETSTPAYAALQDMSDGYNHSALKIMACESAHYTESLWMDDSTNPSTVTRYMRHVPLNNGPGGTGVQYSGLGPNQNYALAYNGFNYGTCVGANSYDATEAARGSLNNHPWQGNVDGTHGCPASGWAWRFYASIRDLESEIGKFERNTIGMDTRSLYNPQGPYGGDRVFGGREHKNLWMPMLHYQQVRGGVGAVTRMKGLIEYGSLRPEYAYFRDFLDSQFGWLKHAFESDDIIGPQARRLGKMFMCDGGAQARWTEGRFVQAVIDIMRARGLYTKNLLKWCSAFGRALMGDPVEGMPIREYIPGSTCGSDTGNNYWINQTALVAFSGPQNDNDKIYQLKDTANNLIETIDARHVCHNNTTHTVIFQTDGNRVRITNHPNRPPIIVGDFFHILAHNSVAPPTGVSKGKLYYFVNNVSNTWQLSSTDPAVATTLVSWTTASELSFTSGTPSGSYIPMSLGGPGPHASGLTNTFNGISDDYFYNEFSSIPMILQMYGTSEPTGAACVDAYNTGKGIMALMISTYDANRFYQGFWCRNGIEYYP